MKKIIQLTIFTAALASCHKLDLNPPSEPSTGTFYSNQTELELAVNDLYRLDYWGNDNELYSDNDVHRGQQFQNAVISGTMTSEDATVRTYWLNCYKAIARANSFLANKDKAAANTPASVIKQYEAEMRLIRAYEYARLITHFGDVPLLKAPIPLEEAYGIGRTAKTEVFDFLNAELDFAAANLPASWPTASVKRLTKGAAFAIKARTALYMGKWAIAKAAADSVIQLANAGVYSLHPNFSQLFLKDGELSKEIIWSIPRDEKQKVFGAAEGWVKEHMLRTAGGYGAIIPSRDVVDAFECTDGLPIDESPLYNPRQPFKNRDPRLTATVVEFGTPWMGYSYQPHPDSLTTRSYKTGAMVANFDNRAVREFASFTGFLWKKGIDQSWADRLVEDNDAIIVRLADMLLTYAEAKIELGEVDGTVLDAINKVRARAYGVPFTAVASYPALTALDPIALKKVVRRERRVEFVKEGLRYMDLIRWRLAENVLTRPVIGIPDPAKQDRNKWPFPGTTPLDDDGIADYSGFGADVKILVERKFDKSKQYLWPIPAIERRVNPNISQNDNY
ncbi:RagB/SusD family nutrient uptake outer membrane protein [Paraflavitalea sp. CAU 1676]|uniref:RagB/SusD family nutrient uptake outer membrane protein n=1 Tax=Paraflavitalea sp. CAU 1676 TaxID=3032598 RepID=UPI0023DC5C97|nr:RagB/SusD family nutrient uptake outer membrane protein [Paraflavitalea sp. CAU 1676]MDF2193485.1 RagB/SusD family nutrient uptake outer membrane protein [Paraflavitalea sp. CAU 1676]